MTIENSYSRFLKDSSWYQHAGEFNAKEMGYLALGLGEAGEFQGEIKKIVRRVGFDDEDAFRNELDENKKKIVLELGDVFWYAVKIASFFGLTVEQVLVLNTLKLYTRMEEMDHNDKLPIEMPKWPFTDDECSIWDAHDLWQETFGESI